MLRTIFLILMCLFVAVGAAHAKTGHNVRKANKLYQAENYDKALELSRKTMEMIPLEMEVYINLI